MTKKNLEEALNEIWKDTKRQKGIVDYWTSDDATRHIELLPKIQRTLALIAANKELALLSRHPGVSALAQQLARAQLSDDDKQKLGQLDTQVMNEWVDGKQEFGRYNQFANLIEDSEKIIESLKMIRERPGEALTSPSSYIRTLAKQSLRSKELKKIKSKFKKTRSSWKPSGGRRK